MIHLGDFSLSGTVYVHFNTYDSNGNPISISGFTTSDIRVYKNGSNVERTSQNGYTLLDTDGIDFDGIIGLHGFSLSLADNSDAGFWSAGSEYLVAVSPIMLGTITGSLWAASFSIEREAAAIALLKNTVFGLSQIKQYVDDLETRLTSTRAGYLDNLSGGAVALQASVDDLEGRLTATRAGYLDNLSAGAVALESTAQAIKTKTDNLPTDPADESNVLAAIAGVQADTDNIQTRIPIALVGGRMDSNVGSLDNDVITAAKIATDAIGSDELAASAVTEIQSGLATSAALATVQADTDDIQTRLPAALVSGRMDSSVGAMATDVLTSTALAASAVAEIQSGLSTLTAAQVNAEVVDALNVDTYGEPGQGAPPVTASLVAKVNYLYKTWRNKKTQTATTRSVFADDGTTVDHKATDSDDGVTYTKGELGTGP